MPGVQEGIMSKQYSALVSFTCFVAMAIILSWAIAYHLGRASVDTVETLEVYRRGELPMGVPVLVYWMESDGTITAASALRTDYAGVLPFSTTGRSVPFDPMDGWFAWSELQPIAMEALR
jgi:hypothetical protein